MRSIGNQTCCIWKAPMHRRRFKMNEKVSNQQGPCLFWSVSCLFWACLLILKRFLVYVETFPFLCWSVPLLILKRFLANSGACSVRKFSLVRAGAVAAQGSTKTSRLGVSNMGPCLGAIVKGHLWAHEQRRFRLVRSGVVAAHAPVGHTLC